MESNLLCRFFGHKFGEWKYVAENSCEQVRICKRDGYEERCDDRHQFGEWAFDYRSHPDGTSERVLRQNCRRCGRLRQVTKSDVIEQIFSSSYSYVNVSKQDITEQNVEDACRYLESHGNFSVSFTQSFGRQVNYPHDRLPDANDFEVENVFSISP